MNVSRRRRWTALAVAAVLSAACGDDDPGVIESNSASLAPVPETSVGTVSGPSASSDPSATTEPQPATSSTALPNVTATHEVTTTVASAAAEDLGLTSTCDGAGSCISLALSETDDLVSYDPSAGRLTFDTAPPRDLVLPPSVSENILFLTAVGPDDVAYFVSQQPEPVDPIGYVAAVSTHPDNAGEVVAVSDDIDLSGDSTLFATPTGLVSVPCCWFERRPGADAEPVIAWVGHAGDPLRSTRADIWIEYPGDGSAAFFRADQADANWTAPNAITRSMPEMGAQDDGGLIVDLTDTFDADSPSRLVRFSVDGTSSEVPIAPARVVLVEASGSVIADVDGRYVRLRPFG